MNALEWTNRNPGWVFASFVADAYRRGGWDVTETTPGTWKVVNLARVAREAAEKQAKGGKR